MRRSIGLAVWITVAAAVVGPVAAGQAREDPPRKLTVVGTWRSPGAARRLEVRWVDTVAPAPEENASPVGPDGKAGWMPLGAMVKRALGHRGFARPAVVFVYDPSFKFRELLLVERSVFGTEELVTALKFVHPLRLKESARYPAGFWFLTSAGRVVARLPLNASRSHVQKALELAFESHYTGKLADAVARYSSWLKRLEAAEDGVHRERNVANAMKLARVQKEEGTALTVPLKKKAKPPRRPAEGEKPAGPAR
jgi:hypothetical protein